MSPDTYLPEFFPLLALFLLIILSIGAGLLFLNRFLRSRNPQLHRSGADGSGFDAFAAVEEKLSLRDYIIAMLFLIFSITAVLLFPWAVANTAIGLSGFVGMVVFIAILLVGYCYAWKKGALEAD